MATRTANQILGILEVDGNVVGSDTDRVHDNAVNPRPEKILMMKGLEPDSGFPEDSRRGGRKGKKVQIDLIPFVLNDGYHGRGIYKKLPK